MAQEVKDPTAVAWVASETQIQSLAQELPQVWVRPLKKKKKKQTNAALWIVCLQQLRISIWTCTAIVQSNFISINPAILKIGVYTLYEFALFFSSISIWLYFYKTTGL